MSMSGARATATNHTPGRETPARPARNPARPPPTTHHQKEGPWPDHHPHNTLRGERPRRGGGETPQDHPPPLTKRRACGPITTHTTHSGERDPGATGAKSGQTTTPPRAAPAPSARALVLPGRAPSHVRPLLPPTFPRPSRPLTRAGVDLCAGPGPEHLPHTTLRGERPRRDRSEIRPDHHPAPRGASAIGACPRPTRARALTCPAASPEKLPPTLLTS